MNIIDVLGILPYYFTLFFMPSENITFVPYPWGSSCEFTYPLSRPPLPLFRCPHLLSPQCPTWSPLMAALRRRSRKPQHLAVLLRFSRSDPQQHLITELLDKYMIFTSYLHDIYVIYMVYLVFSKFLVIWPFRTKKNPKKQTNWSKNHTNWPENLKKIESRGTRRTRFLLLCLEEAFLYHAKMLDYAQHYFYPHFVDIGWGGGNTMDYDTLEIKC